MAGKRVAVTTEVFARPGDKMFGDAVSGVWTADPITYKAYDHLAASGKSVIHSATCTFRFTGQRSDGSPVTGQERVDLRAGKTVLQGTLSGVLLNADSATGTFGNRLEAKTSNALRSH